MTLAPGDFAAFFGEVHGHAPFPWQRVLLERVAAEGVWPDKLDLPTGAGKTAAIDVAVFHLALEASRGAARLAPVRIVFVVDRRLVVDDAFERARRIERAIREPTGPATVAVAEALRALALAGPPLLARRLRGGIPREDDWARTPSQPTVLCSTVDQVGSRLLFRGYGLSDSMKPVHAGLIGSDCLLLLDEAHLSEPFRQTLGWVQRYRSTAWRESTSAAPWGVALLTATPGADGGARFSLDQDPHDLDSKHPVLQRRLLARKLGPMSVDDANARAIGAARLSSAGSCSTSANALSAEGATSPKSTSATACPPSWPGSAVALAQGPLRRLALLLLGLQPCDILATVAMRPWVVRARARADQAPAYVGVEAGTADPEHRGSLSGAGRRELYRPLILAKWLVDTRFLRAV